MISCLYLLGTTYVSSKLRSMYIIINYILVNTRDTDKPYTTA